MEDGKPVLTRFTNQAARVSLIDTAWFLWMAYLIAMRSYAKRFLALIFFYLSIRDRPQKE